MLRAREAVLRMKEYHPPLGGRDGMRLDFNENTAGCSPRVLAKLRTMGKDALATYPEREPVERIAAEFLGLQQSQVLLTNGVDEAIHLLCETYLEPEDEVIIPVPTFSMYEIYASAAGARIVTVQSDDQLGIPVDRILKAITPRTRMIAIANPNNPTGAVTEAESLFKIARSAPDAAVLIDEAYQEFYGKTLMDQVGSLPNLFAARTFSKAYGLAGLRAGVLAGAAESMRMVRRVGSPYNVNAAALACLPEALADREYVSEYVAQVRRGRQRIETELRESGICSWPSEANFVLFCIGEKRKEFVDAMRSRGVLIRDRNSDPGCAGCVRITVGTDAQTDIAIRALRESLTEIGWKSASFPTLRCAQDGAPGATESGVTA